jgi:hypothetical protein
MTRLLLGENEGVSVEAVLAVTRTYPGRLTQRGGREGAVLGRGSFPASEYYCLEVGK